MHSRINVIKFTPLATDGVIQRTYVIKFAPLDPSNLSVRWLSFGLSHINFYLLGIGGFRPRFLGRGWRLLLSFSLQYLAIWGLSSKPPWVSFCFHSLG